jgi:Zn-dependent protease
MPWSWKLARIAGIDVYVHATFFMVIAWIALVHWNESQSVAAVVEGVGFILTLFACVVLHEYGHALTAARYGIRRTSRCFLSEAWRDSNDSPMCPCKSSGSRWPDRPSTW